MHRLVQSNRVRWIAVAVSVMLVALAVTSITVAHATAAGRNERSEERGFVVAGDGSPRLQFAERRAALGGGAAKLVYLRALDPQMPPPPGLGSWPAPGTVAAAPSVLGERDQIERLVGPISAVIADEGLGTPNERLIYVFPRSEIVQPRAWQDAEGFGFEAGDTAAQTYGEVWEVGEPALLDRVLVLFLVAPSVWLLVTAAGVGAKRDDHRSVMLETLGMSPRRIAWARWSRVGTAWLAGNVAAWLAVGASTVWGVRLPGIGWVVYGPDLSSAFGSVALGLGLAAILSCAILAVRCWPQRPGRSTGVAVAPAQYPRRAVVACCAALAVMTAWTYASIWTGSEAALLPAMVLALALAASAPFLSGWLLRVLGGPLARDGLRRGAPAALVAGRVLQVDTRSAAGLAAGFVVLAVLVSVAAALAALNGAVFSEVREARAAAGQAILEVGVPNRVGANEELGVFKSALPGSVGLVAVTTDLGAGSSDGEPLPVTLRAEPGVLADWGLAAGPTPVSALPAPLPAVLLGMGVSGPVAVESLTGPLDVPEGDDTVSTTILLKDADGRRLDAEQLQEDVNAVMAPGWPITEMFDTWYVGAELAGRDARWVTWSAMLGGAMVVTALWLRTWQDVWATAQRAAILGVFAYGRGVEAKFVAARVAPPVAAGALGGFVLGFAAGAPILAFGALPAGYVTRPLLMLVGLSLLAGAAVWLIATIKGRELMSRWRPGGEWRYGGRG